MRLVEIRRVSTEEQARDDHAGLDRQAHQNRLTAERLGATIIHPPFVLSDVCRENFVDTPEWTAIRDMISAADIHIVVDQQDRIVAGLAGVQILFECQRTGTHIYTSNGEVDVSTFTGQVVGLLGAAIAADELCKIRHRVQGAKEAKRRRGICPSADITLATGIAYVRSKAPTGEVSGRWSYDTEIERVKEVFRLAVHEGERNWREVGRKTGFSGITVRNILRNPIYKGLWVLTQKRAQGTPPIKPDGRRKDRPKILRAPSEVIQAEVFRPKGMPQDPNDDREEAAVDTTTWEAAQVIVAEKTNEHYKPRDPRGRSRFIYTGLLWCASCGTPIYGKTRPEPGKRRDWYVCKRKAMSCGDCPTGWLPLAKVNVALDRLFGGILADQRIIAGLVQEALGSEHEDFTSRIALAQTTIAKLTAKRTKLLDLYMDDGWSKEELDARRAKIDGEMDRVQRELRQLTAAQSTARQASALAGLRDVLVAMAEFEYWSPQQRRDLLKRFFPRIEVSRDGVERITIQLPITTTLGSIRVSVPEHEMPLVLDVHMKWLELQPPVAQTDFGLPEKEFYTRRDILNVLDWSDWMLKDRLKRGLLPEPSRKVGGKRAWTAGEIRQALIQVNAKPEAYRWGLPRKPFYSTPEVIRILGTEWQKLRYAIDTGRAKDCAQRDANGHRMWTEEEVERAVAAWAAITGGTKASRAESPTESSAVEPPLAVSTM